MSHLGHSGGTAILSAVTTAQFDRTNTTVPADVTGMSLTFAAGVTYKVDIYLPMANATGTNGAKVTLAGTATATYAFLDIFAAAQDDTSIPANNTLNFNARAVTIAPSVDFGAFAVASAPTKFMILITGTIVTNAGGTLKVQFAQSLGGVGQTSSVLRGATMIATPVA